jgi:2,3-bisphosphoglycerate-independent phosphoglycerate mutase
VAHTTNPVPFFLVDPTWSVTACTQDGSLANLAPTVMSALGIVPAFSMTGETLTPGYEWGRRRRVLLIILDGWGFGKKDATNPIFLASTPVWDDLCKNFPYSKLKASGEVVGLKPGKAGNSEAGHMNIGAGRVILQDDVRLDMAMKDGSFYTNEVFLHAMQDVKKRGVNLHLIGLLSEKSSHGSIDYPLALLKMAKEHGVENAFLHMIFDGRSTMPGSAPELLEKLEKKIDAIGLGLVVTGIGRGYALDRDQNYARIKHAYDALVTGTGKKIPLTNSS